MRSVLVIWRLTILSVLVTFPTLASRSAYASDGCKACQYRYDPAARYEPATFAERHAVRVMPHPVLSQKPPAFREVPKPASQAPKPEVSEGEEGTLSLTRADYEAAHEVSATHGYDAGHTQGYTKGYAEGLATAKGKMRLLSREEAIEIGLKAARRAIERRLGKKDP